ncbi:MAG: efflux RND transporter periplasmic adaptor subunit, partial [Alphaproteobacteria bacterium]|nr:efflux RND transporter periplasmic adaptor subunit [Alphaproteobacteria bacterium]
MIRRLITLVFIVLIASGIGYYVKTKYFTEDKPTIMTAAVSRGDVRDTVLATGILKPAKLVAIGAQVSGRITDLHVSLGQKIKTGDLIAEIDSVTQVNALKTSEASLADVKAQRAEKSATLTQAQSTLARQKRMIAQNAISQSDFEAAEADVKTINAQIAALDARIVEAAVAVETAKANLGYTQITAPIDGTILAIVSQEGQTVNAAQSTPTIVIVGQLDTMTVRTEISEVDIVRVAPGQRVFFNILADTDRRYEATLDSIEPAPESIRSDSSITTSSSTSTSTSSSAVYYIGVFNTPNPDGLLRTYMTAEVHIVIAEALDVLTIPTEALGRKGKDGGYTVNILGEDGQISPRKITIGLNDKSIVEVLSGLEEGEKV